MPFKNIFDFSLIFDHSRYKYVCKKQKQSTFREEFETMNTVKTCYMCDKPATSREHAPPKCLFPKEEHSLSGENRRRGMITVPSCDEHNGDKSADDSYLMQILPMSIGLNEVAEFYFKSKVSSLVEKDKKFLKRLNDTAIPVTVHDTETDTFTRTVMFKADHKRILGALNMNARAIYFYHHQTKLNAPFKTFVNFSLIEGSPKLNDLNHAVFTATDGMLNDVCAVRHGQNPEVFFYRTHREGDVELLELTFYGSSKVLFCIDHPAAAA